MKLSSLDIQTPPCGNQRSRKTSLGQVGSRGTLRRSPRLTLVADADPWPAAAPAAIYLDSPPSPPPRLIDRIFIYSAITVGAFVNFYFWGRLLGASTGWF